MSAQKRRRTVIVTGAESRIGRSTAILLGEKGHQVLACGNKKKAMADLPRETAPGGIIETHHSELKTNAEIKQALKRAQELFGGFDALVTSASRGHFQSVEEVKESQTRDLFDQNFFEPMRIIQQAIPVLRDAGSGTIVCLSSTAGRVALPMSGAYCATQYALEGLCDTLRLELSIFGIDVVLIEPGFVRESVAGRNSSEQRSRRFKPPSEDSPYYQLGNLLHGSIEELAKKAASPTDVSKLVHRALTAARPKPRYAISRSAAALLWAKKVLPDRFVDGRLAKAMGLKDLD